MKKKGFTLIEGIVIIGVMAILAVVLFSLFSRARVKARKITCQSNLKELALGMLMYAKDWDDKLMPGGYGQGPMTEKRQAWWAQSEGTGTPLSQGVFGCYPMALFAQVPDKELYHCPLDTNRDLKSGLTLSYAGNGGCTPNTSDFDCKINYCPDIAGVLNCQGRALKEIPDPGNTILLGCLPYNPAKSRAKYYINQSGIDCFTMSPPGLQNYIMCWMGILCGPDTVGNGNWDETGDRLPVGQLIHNGGANWAFCDGRVKWLRMEQTINPRNLWLKDSTAGERGWDPYGNFAANR